MIDLEDERFYRLWTALAGHDRPDIDNKDVTVRICWDAERLDLPRLGISLGRACCTPMRPVVGT